VVLHVDVYKFIHRFSYMAADKVRRTLFVAKVNNGVKLYQ